MDPTDSADDVGVSCRNPRCRGKPETDLFSSGEGAQVRAPLGSDRQGRGEGKGEEKEAHGEGVGAARGTVGVGLTRSRSLFVDP